MAGLPAPLVKQTIPQIYLQQEVQKARAIKEAEQQRVYQQQQVAAEQNYYKDTILTQLPESIKTWATTYYQQQGKYPSVESTNSQIDAYNAKNEAEYNRAQTEYNKALAEYNAQIAAQEAKVKAESSIVEQELKAEQTRFNTKSDNFIKNSILTSVDPTTAQWAESYKQSTGSYPNIELIQQKYLDNSGYQYYRLPQDYKYYDKDFSNVYISAGYFPKEVIQGLNSGKLNIRDVYKQGIYKPGMTNDSEILLHNPKDITNKYYAFANANPVSYTSPYYRNIEIQRQTAEYDRLLAEKAALKAEAAATQKAVSVPSSTITAGNIFGGKQDYLARPDITPTEQLGDKTTQALIAQGMSVEQALNKQMTMATTTRAQEYYRNELDKALQASVGVSSAYHHWAKDTGSTQPINPFENVGDIALGIKQGNIKGSLDISKSALSAISALPSGLSVQEAGWKAAVQAEKGQKVTKLPSFESALSQLDIAKETKDLGIYGNLKAYSSTLGILDTKKQQEVASKANLPKYKEGQTIYSGYSPTVIQEALGYGQKFTKPSDIEKTLSGRLALQGVKLTPQQSAAVNLSYDMSSSAAAEFFSTPKQQEVAPKSQKIQTIVEQPTLLEPEKAKGLLYISPKGVELRPQAFGESVSDIESSFDQLFGYSRKGGYLSKTPDVLGATGAFQQAVGRYTTLNLPDITGIKEEDIGTGLLGITTSGAILAAPRTQRQPATEFAGAVAKTIYSDFRENPLEDLLWFGTPKIIKGAKLTVEKGVAKAALSTSPTVSRIGQALSTPTAIRAGKLIEPATFGLLAIPAVESVVKAEPTPTGYGTAIGHITYPLVLGIAGMPYAKSAYNEKVWNPYVQEKVTVAKKVTVTDPTKPTTKVKLQERSWVDLVEPTKGKLTEIIGLGTKETRAELKAAKAELVEAAAKAETKAIRTASRFDVYDLSVPMRKLPTIKPEATYRIPGTTRTVKASTVRTAAIGAGAITAGALGITYGPQIVEKVKETTTKYPWTKAALSTIVVGSLGHEFRTETKEKATLKDLMREAKADRERGGRYSGMSNAEIKTKLIEENKYNPDVEFTYEELYGKQKQTTTLEQILESPREPPYKPISTTGTRERQRYTAYGQIFGKGAGFIPTTIQPPKPGEPEEPPTKPEKPIKKQPPKIGTPIITKEIDRILLQRFRKPPEEPEKPKQPPKIKTPPILRLTFARPPKTPPKPPSPPTITTTSTLKLLLSPPPEKPPKTPPPTPPTEKPPTIIKPPIEKPPKAPPTTSIITTTTGTRGSGLFALPTIKQEIKKKRKKRGKELPKHWEYGYGATPYEASAFIFGTSAQPQRKRPKQLSRKVRKPQKRKATGSSWVDKVMR